jgi:hypothetical protein
MNTIWKLLETCIVPIITYGSETWEPTKKEINSTNQILYSIIKRILKVPTSTPREALYIETGIIDTNHTRIQKRIAMLHRLNQTKNNLIDKTLKKTSTQAWKPKTEKLIENINYHPPNNEETKNIKKKAKTSHQCNLSYQYHKSK